MDVSTFQDKCRRECKNSPKSSSSESCFVEPLLRANDFGVDVVDVVIVDFVVVVVDVASVVVSSSCASFFNLC